MLVFCVELHRHCQQEPGLLEEELISLRKENGSYFSVPLGKLGSSASGNLHSSFLSCSAGGGQQRSAIPGLCLSTYRASNMISGTSQYFSLVHMTTIGYTRAEFSLMLKEIKALLRGKLVLTRPSRKVKSNKVYSGL